MAVRFRCTHCGRLLSITSRRIGQFVPCPDCGTEILVPERDIFDEVPVAVVPPAEPLEPVKPPSIEFAAAPDFVTEAEPPFDPNDEEDEDEPAFRPRRSIGEVAEMDLTPMVDVTFLLLIFFMVTASFSLQKAIRTPVPDEDQKGAVQSIQQLEDLQATSIIVRIDDRDHILVDDEPVSDTERLGDVFRDKMRMEQKTEVIVNADANSRHRTVVGVVDAANAAGMQKIRMATTTSKAQ